MKILEAARSKVESHMQRHQPKTPGIMQQTAEGDSSVEKQYLC